MDWNDPKDRLELAERVGPDEYNRQMQQHIADSTVETVNGHSIRPMQSRFGRLFMVGKTGMAFRTIEEAREYARSVSDD